MKSPLERVAELLLSLLVGASPLLIGCSAGSSTPTSGTPKPQPRTGTPPKHPDFLDGPILPEKQVSRQQIEEHNKLRDQMMFLMELNAMPPIEGAAMLESLKPSEYDERTLQQHRLRIFQQLTSEQILDDELARAILRLGETLRRSSLAEKPSGVLFVNVVLAMVKSHDHLGEAAEGDALVDESLLAMQEFLRTTPVLPTADTPEPATVRLVPSTTPSSPAPDPGEPSSGIEREPAAQTAAQSTPRPGSGIRHRVVMTSGGAVRKHEDWRQLLEFKAMRLARRDFPAADALVHAEAKVAGEAMLAAPDDLNVVREWLSFTGLRARVARLAGQDEMAAAIEKEREEKVRSVAEAHPDSAEHYALYLTFRGNEVARLIRREPQKAQKHLAELRASIEVSAFAKDPSLARITEAWNVYDRMIDDSQFRQDLIGRPAPLFDVGHWVHGPPLPLQSLEGRVVLIAFCQVNFKPCVDLYPWLNSLHEEWHHRGLEVIQIVRPIRLSWNATANGVELNRERLTVPKARPRILDVTLATAPGSNPLATDREGVVGPPQSPEKRSPHDSEAVVEAQVRMLEQLAVHYKHRFPTLLVPPGSSMHYTYGSKALPHLVVLDRKGIIRLIDDAPDDVSRRSLRETLERLLSE